MNKRNIPQFNDSIQVHKLSFYDGGVMFNPGTITPNPTGKGGGKRGKVKGWSMASRRRMRETLLKSTFPGMTVYGVTLTIPGPVLEPHRAKDLWADFSVRANQAGLSAIWRIEIQQRGSLHWHLLAGTPNGQNPEIWNRLWLQALSRVGPVALLHDTVDNPSPVQIMEAVKDILLLDSVTEDIACPGYVWAKFRTHGKVINGKYRSDVWRHIVDEVIETVQLENETAVTVWNDLALWPGAEVYACDVSVNDGSGSWLRYLNDHSTKCKQEQIPYDIGRHWGIIGRKRIGSVDIPEISYLSKAEYHQIRRWFERMATGQGHNPKSVFGRSLRYKVKVGRFGRAARFCNPETLRKMVNFVISQR